jgi:hypothetical protein
MLPEATVPDLLLEIAQNADFNLKRFGEAIENRNLQAMKYASEATYPYVMLLRRFSWDYELPGDWTERIGEIWKEFQYLKALALELMRRAQAGA